MKAGAAGTLRIDPRFRGPPESGNGGYVAGCIARMLGPGSAEVTLRRPPPLATNLHFRARGADGIELVDGEETIGTALRRSFSLAVPPPPEWEPATLASRSFTGFAHHIFPSCFVCGPERAAGDGLRIFAGPWGEQVASPWTPDASLRDPDDLVATPFVWAALDCPGFFAVQDQSGPALLGRITAAITRRPRVSERLIVTGWRIGGEGRKHVAGTAIHDLDGRRLAAAEAVWISVPPAATHPTN